ncbi:hypothetical protein BGW41_003271 [Actinomortierella wolfii]|nr:hypothetical protein BGW41_003271 [Actinomortierella wolfii]
MSTQPPRKKQLKGAGRDQFQEFIKFFQDPDDAQRVINEIKAAPPFDPSEDHSAHGKKRKAKDSDDDTGDKPYKGPSSRAIAFRALQLHLDYSNQLEVFVAVFFLTKNLPKALEHSDEFLSKVVMFKALAAHLDATEPLLKGVTGMALLSLHDRVVAKRKELMETLKSDTLDASQKLEWRDTKLSDAARTLIGLDDQLNEVYVNKEGDRRHKKHKADKAGAGASNQPPVSGNKKNSQESSSSASEDGDSTKAANTTAAPSSTAKPAAASNTEKAKEPKKEKKEKKDKKDKPKDKEQPEQSTGDKKDTNPAASTPQKTAPATVSAPASSAASKPTGISQTVVDMLLERIKALEDEVKELRRKTYDNGDAIKELKWQRVAH